MGERGNMGREIVRVVIAAVVGLAIGCSPAQEEPAKQGSAPTAMVEIGASAKPADGPAKKAAPPLPPPTDEEGLPPEIMDRVLEIRFFEESAPDTFQKCLDALKDAHFAVRREAVAKFEDLGGDRAIQTLGDVLTKDVDAKVRVRAAEALSFLSYMEAKPALEQLVRGLDDADADVREVAADALRYYGTPQHKPVIAAAIAKEPDREVKSILEEALENADLPATRKTEAPAKPDTKSQ